MLPVILQPPGRWSSERLYLQLTVHAVGHGQQPAEVKPPLLQQSANFIAASFPKLSSPFPTEDQPERESSMFPDESPRMPGFLLA